MTMTIRSTRFPFSICGEDHDAEEAIASAAHPTDVPERLAAAFAQRVNGVALWRLEKDSFVLALQYENGQKSRIRPRRIDATSASHLLLAQTQKSWVFGPLANNRGNRALLDAMGRPYPYTALVFPLWVGGKIVALLYADNAKASVSSETAAFFACLVARAGSRLQTLSMPDALAESARSMCDE